MLTPLGMAAVNVAIPSMASELSASATQVGWLPTIYILSNVAALLPMGKLADMYGRKKIYLLGLILSVVAAGFAGLSQHMELILFWRFVQGLSAAMIFGTGIAIVSEEVSSEKRGWALGIVASSVYVGLTMAPAVGGALTQYFGWRAVFLFQVPLFLILIAYITVYMTGEWKSEAPGKFDYKGSTLFIVFASSFVVGMSLLPQLLGITLIALSIIALLLFILHQRRSVSPLIRVQLFVEKPIFSFSLGTSFFMYGSNFATFFLISLYLQFILQLSPIVSGNILLLQALAMAFIAPLAGKLSDKYQARNLASIGTFIVLIGYCLMRQIDTGTSSYYVGGAFFIIGIGFALFSTPNNNAIMGAVSKNEIGIASSSMNLARTIGNLVGMSIVNLILHLMIGARPISIETNTQLMISIYYALNMSIGFVAIACCLSMARGKH